MPEDELTEISDSFDQMLRSGLMAAALITEQAARRGGERSAAAAQATEHRAAAEQDRAAAELDRMRAELRHVQQDSWWEHADPARMARLWEQADRHSAEHPDFAAARDRMREQMQARYGIDPTSVRPDGRNLDGALQAVIGDERAANPRPVPAKQHGSIQYDSSEKLHAGRVHPRIGEALPERKDAIRGRLENDLPITMGQRPEFSAGLKHGYRAHLYGTDSDLDDCLERLWPDIAAGYTPAAITADGNARPGRLQVGTDATGTGVFEAKRLVAGKLANGPWSIHQEYLAGGVDAARTREADLRGYARRVAGQDPDIDATIGELWPDLAPTRPTEQSTEQAMSGERQPGVDLSKPERTARQQQQYADAGELLGVPAEPGGLPIWRRATIQTGQADEHGMAPRMHTTAALGHLDQAFDRLGDHEQYGTTTLTSAARELTEHADPVSAESSIGASIRTLSVDDTRCLLDARVGEANTPGVVSALHRAGVLHADQEDSGVFQLPADADEAARRVGSPDGIAGGFDGWAGQDDRVDDALTDLTARRDALTGETEKTTTTPMPGSDRPPVTSRADTLTDANGERVSRDEVLGSFTDAGQRLADMRENGIRGMHEPARALVAAADENGYIDSLRAAETITGLPGNARGGPHVERALERAGVVQRQPNGTLHVGRDADAAVRIIGTPEGIVSRLARYQRQDNEVDQRFHELRGAAREARRGDPTGAGPEQASEDDPNQHTGPAMTKGPDQAQQHHAAPNGYPRSAQADGAARARRNSGQEQGQTMSTTAKHTPGTSSSQGYERTRGADMPTANAGQATTRIRVADAFARPAHTFANTTRNMITKHRRGTNTQAQQHGANLHR